MPKLTYALKAVRELGLEKSALYALYRTALKSGYYKWAGSGERKHPPRLSIHPVLHLPTQYELTQILGNNGRTQLLDEAQEIAGGCIRLFGGQPVPLELALTDKQEHWSVYENNQASIHYPGMGTTDPKFIWEPARFGWAFTLGRAYHLTKDEKYASTFWKYLEIFIEANPPYMGLNWSSAQEVALRLMALVFGAQIFSDSANTTPERRINLAIAVANHAERIPPTLIYARSQNNNHLLSEATGLYTAGLALPDHSSAKRWISLGWRWFHRGLASQIASDGTYMQHSTNYHRLMLQLALWVKHLAGVQGQEMPKVSLERLSAATQWLLAMLDPVSGYVPNLGPNDGAYILPFTIRPFNDYRPVLQAAASSFLDGSTLVPEVDGEMNLWLCSQAVNAVANGNIHTTPDRNTPHILRSADRTSWAYLRAVHFKDRPGHADQLHLDLWWRGLNIAQDAGTYLYNAPPPWDNALTYANVHNTITVNGQDQMTRAGRFLYLDWAQSQVLRHELLEDGLQSLTAKHDGFKPLGVSHERCATVTGEGIWLIEDLLQPCKATPGKLEKEYAIQIHWLLPDWHWTAKEINGKSIITDLVSPYGTVTISIHVETAAEDQGSIIKLQIVRASELCYGTGYVSPAWGWSSPTYGDKIPALSMRAEVKSPLPVRFLSEWRFPALKD